MPRYAVPTMPPTKGYVTDKDSEQESEKVNSEYRKLEYNILYIYMTVWTKTCSLAPAHCIHKQNTVIMSPTILEVVCIANDCMC